MRRFRNKLISAVLVISLVLPLCACNSSKKHNDMAKEFVGPFYEALKSGDTATLMTYIDDPDVTEDYLKSIIYPSDLNSEQSSYVEAIRETIDYEGDAAVFDKEINTSTLYIDVTVGHYFSEAALKADNIQDFKAALANEPKRVACPLVQVAFDGDNMKILGAVDLIKNVYDFTSFDSGIMPGQLSDFYSDSELVLAPKGVYINTDTIGVRVNFDKKLQSYRFVPGVMYTVSRGDEVIYVSDVVKLEDNSIRFDLTPDMLKTEDLNSDGFLIPGKYTFIVFDEHSNDICSIDCTVQVEEIEKDEISFESFKKDYYLSNLVYEFNDDDLMAHTYVFNSGWWDYDGTSVGKSAFASNTKTLGFSLAVSKDNESELFYEYYYSEESDFSDIDVENPLFESSCKPSVYDDQACYDLDFTPKDGLEPGFYGLVIYSDASKKHIVFTASCIVVEETSGDVL